MTTPSAVADELRTEIFNRFAIAQPAVPMFAENQPVDRPDNTIFTICEIMPTEQQRADLNSSRKLIRSMGVVNVRVMVPQETGKRDGLLVLDELYAILTDRQFAIPGGGHVTTYGTEINTRGEINGYYALGISCVYRAYITLDR